MYMTTMKKVRSSNSGNTSSSFVSPYVLRLEAQVLRSVHQMGILLDQLSLQKKHYKELVKNHDDYIKKSYEEASELE